MMSAVSGQEVTDEQKEVIQRYSALKQELQELYSKIAEIDADKSEHELVLSQLNGLDSGRKCWQQVGEVLTETNVEALVPVLESKRKNIEEAIVKLSEAVSAKETQLGEIQKKYNIRERPQGS